VRPWNDRSESAEIVDSIFAVPPIFDLPASGEQTVRLAARNKGEASVEEAYVISVKEVADETNVEGTGLAMALEMRIPVFVTPPNVMPKPEWSIRGWSGEKPAIVLTNSGDAHLRVESLKLARTKSAEPIVEIRKGRHALAGQEIDWPIDIDLVDLKGAMFLQARTNVGLIEETVAIPSN
jgi:P pilus assembly chaperone PapD